MQVSCEQNARAHREIRRHSCLLFLARPRRQVGKVTWPVGPGKPVCSLHRLSTCSEPPAQGKDGSSSFSKRICRAYARHLLVQVLLG